MRLSSSGSPNKGNYEFCPHEIDENPERERKLRNGEFGHLGHFEDCGGFRGIGIGHLSMVV